MLQASILYLRLEQIDAAALALQGALDLERTKVPRRTALRNSTDRLRTERSPAPVLGPLCVPVVNAPAD